MKLVVCGGRDYAMTFDDAILLARVAAEFGVDELVSGACRGVDQDCERWARASGIKIRQFNPQWDDYGSAAGPKRNAEMAAYADVVLAFPGGVGTMDMVDKARRGGLQSANKWAGAYRQYEF